MMGSDEVLHEVKEFLSPVQVGKLPFERSDAEGYGKKAIVEVTDLVIEVSVGFIGSDVDAEFNETNFVVPFPGSRQKCHRTIFRIQSWYRGAAIGLKRGLRRSEQSELQTVTFCRIRITSLRLTS